MTVLEAELTGYRAAQICLIWSDLKCDCCIWDLGFKKNAFGLNALSVGLRLVMGVGFLVNRSSLRCDKPGKDRGWWIESNIHDSLSITQSRLRVVVIVEQWSLILDRPPRAFGPLPLLGRSRLCVSQMCCERGSRRDPTHQYKQPRLIGLPFTSTS